MRAVRDPYSVTGPSEKGDSPVDQSALECEVVSTVPGFFMSRGPMILIMFMVLCFDGFAGCGLS